MYKEKKDLINLFSGVCVTGLVHPVAYAFNALGIAIMGILACIIDIKRNFKTVWRVFIAGVVSVVISLTPMIIGWIFGKEFHSSSIEFLSDKIINISYPHIKFTDIIALCGLLLLVIYLIINFKELKRYFIELYIVLFSIIAFLFYYYGGVVTQSAVIATRFSDLWGLTSPIAMGIGLYCLTKIIRNISIRRITEIILCTSMLLGCLIYIKPEPIIPYKMERNEEVEQYLRISSIYNPTQWAIVSDTEGAYSQILGRGTHIRTEEFLRKHNPRIDNIYYEGSEYKIPDIFIYYDKKSFSFGYSENLPQRLINSTERREAANKELADWLYEYKKTHENIEVFYEDENFMIFHIQQEMTRDETLKKIFNN